MAQSARNPIRILLVEDEVEARHAIARFLENRGYRVDSAGSAREAFSCAAAGMPDVVICDWRLGRDDGVEIVRRLQKQTDLVAIFMTGNSLADLRSAASDLAVSRFLRKPVTLDRIAAEVATALQH